MEGWKQGLQRPFILAFFTASSLPASPPRWQQLASDAAGTPILEKVLLMSRHFLGTGFSSLNHRDQDSWRWRELQGSTTDLQPWSVRCVNKFILKASSTRSGQLSPASLLQVPTRPTSLDGCPGTSRSRRWSRFAVLWTCELPLDSATFWFPSQPLKSLYLALGVVRLEWPGGDYTSPLCG